MTKWRATHSKYYFHRAQYYSICYSDSVEINKPVQAIVLVIVVDEIWNLQSIQCLSLLCLCPFGCLYFSCVVHLYNYCWPVSTPHTTFADVCGGSQRSCHQVKSRQCDWRFPVLKVCYFVFLPFILPFHFVFFTLAWHCRPWLPVAISKESISEGCTM